MKIALTLLYIDRETAHRADFAGGRPPRLVRSASRPRPAGSSSLAAAVDAAIVGEKIGKSVWVLAPELWSQPVALPRESASGLEGDDLARALAFESEPFSGVPAIEAALAFRPLPTPPGEDPEFWATACERSGRDQIAEAVERAGGKLAGLLHPMGLPAPMAESSGPASWSRVELWPDAILCAKPSGGKAGEAAFHLIADDPLADRWREEALEWLGGPPSEALISGEAFAGLGFEETPEASLDDEPAREAWLGAWARALAAGQGAVPVVGPPPKELPASLQTFAAAALAGLALLTCYGINSRLSARLGAIQNEIRQLRAPAQHLAEHEKQRKKIERETAELRAKLAETRGRLAAWTEAVETQRGRHGAALDALARLRPDDLVIEEISASEGGMRVAGLALRPELPNHFAMLLQADLAPSGWSVSPASKQAKLALADGGPWTFEVFLSPASPPAPREGETS